jgi:hypothetical protein
VNGQGVGDLVEHTQVEALPSVLRVRRDVGRVEKRRWCGGQVVVPRVRVEDLLEQVVLERDAWLQGQVDGGQPAPQELHRRGRGEQVVGGRPEVVVAAGEPARPVGVQVAPARRPGQAHHPPPERLGQLHGLEDHRLALGVEAFAGLVLVVAAGVALRPLLVQPVLQLDEPALRTPGRPSGDQRDEQ